MTQFLAASVYVLFLLMLLFIFASMCEWRAVIDVESLPQLLPVFISETEFLTESEVYLDSQWTPDICPALIL